jgi:lysophospholipase L1-like esterase
MLRQNWNHKNRHGEGFPGAGLRHLCPHPRKPLEHDIFRLECPPLDSKDYRVIIIQLGGNDVHNKRYHQTNDNTETEDEAKQNGLPIKRQSAAEFELITARTIIEKMKRGTNRLRKKFPHSHLVQLSIQPRQEIDGKTTIRTVKCITEEIKKERSLRSSIFNQGDAKVHYLEISGVWETNGEIRRELYNDRGDLTHMSTQGNNTLDALYTQIEDFLTETNFNRTDTPTKKLTGTCHNGKITLYN